MQKAPPTPKGFRDIDPQLAQKRRQVVSQIVDVLETFGFVPLETPTIEFASTLKGKYGEEERLIYEFKDRGGRELALRYDLTVPLARYVAANPSLPMPFRRYQIGQVFRGENPQAGRYREFTQLDFDSVGGKSYEEEDALIIETIIKSVRKLGLKDFQLKINFRQTLKSLADVIGIAEDKQNQVFREMDKVGKKTQSEIDQAIVTEGNFPEIPYVSAATISGTISYTGEYSKPQTVDKLLENFKGFKPPQNTNLPVVTESEIKKELKRALELSRKIDESINEPSEFKRIKEYLIGRGVDLEDFAFERTLVRGLDYYTGIFFELKPSKASEDLTIGSGGRYDNLIGMFSKKQIPAVGFSFGLDRLIEALD